MLSLCFLTDIKSVSLSSSISLPLYTSTVPAGLPFHGDDHVDASLNLNDYLVKNPASTFFVRVSGSSMKDVGIQDGDLLVVDRSISPRSGQIVIAAINGELTVKRFKKAHQKVSLEPENPAFSSLQLREEDLLIWGVVTSVIHKF